MDCIFCKIIAGEIPSSKVYEDEDFIAFLDIQPNNFGHTLLVPKKHFVNVYDTSEEVGSKIYPLLTKISNAVKKATGCDGINIIQNNEADAGQVVFHSHIHIIPRYKDDFTFKAPHKEYENFEVMGKMAEDIASNL